MRRFHFASCLLALAVAACSTGGPSQPVSRQAPVTQGLEADAGDRYIVQFNDAAAGRAAVASVGGRVVLDLPSVNGVAVILPAEAIGTLRGNSAVRHIEHDAKRYALSERTPYGISMVQADDAAFDGAVGSKKVCIIDSGYHTGHTDLASANVTGQSAGWDDDTCGHGTHVAGTIAALGGNGEGVRGVLPGGVPIHIVQVFDGSNCQWSYSSSLIDAADKCRENGASVISMSLGGGSPSDAERTAFKNLLDNHGILSIAAAGNDGNTALSYPASYSSVVSVAAVDSTEAVASFSQKNAQVEVAAPGVGVESTVPWAQFQTLEVGGTTYAGFGLDGAGTGQATGDLADGGYCGAADPAWAGKVVLCQRGDGLSFRDKAKAVQDSGAVAAVIYNNEPGPFAGLIRGKTPSIVVIGLSDTDGQDALTHVGESGTALATELIQPGSGYESWSGTSMATPHVSGVAALLWSMHETASAQDIRTALVASANDAGDAGRDDAYGYGIVQAAAAHALLNGGAASGCIPAPGQEVVETSCEGGTDDDCDGKADGDDSDCGGSSGGGGGGACLPVGDPCTSPAECCLGICAGKRDAKTCK